MGWLVGVDVVATLCAYFWLLNKEYNVPRPFTVWHQFECCVRTGDLVAPMFTRGILRSLYDCEIASYSATSSRRSNRIWAKSRIQLKLGLEATGKMVPAAYTSCKISHLFVARLTIAWVGRSMNIRTLVQNAVRWGGAANRWWCFRGSKSGNIR